jgi:hypothetical protein
MNCFLQTIFHLTLGETPVATWHIRWDDELIICLAIEHCAVTGSASGNYLSASSLNDIHDVFLDTFSRTQPICKSGLSTSWGVTAVSIGTTTCSCNGWWTYHFIPRKGRREKGERQNFTPEVTLQVKRYVVILISTLLVYFPESTRHPCHKTGMNSYLPDAYKLHNHETILFLDKRESTGYVNYIVENQLP